MNWQEIISLDEALEGESNLKFSGLFSLLMDGPLSFYLGSFGDGPLNWIGKIPVSYELELSILKSRPYYVAKSVFGYNSHLIYIGYSEKDIGENIRNLFNDEKSKFREIKETFFSLQVGIYKTPEPKKEFQDFLGYYTKITNGYLPAMNSRSELKGKFKKTNTYLKSKNEIILLK